MKKKIFAVILGMLLVFSLTACSDEPAADPSSSEPESSSSQGSGAETESSSEEEEAPADDAEPESSGSQKEPAASSEQSTRSQAPVQEQQPVESQPAESRPEEEPVAQEPTQPVTQPGSQSQAPASSSQDDPTAWTQEKVDAVVEAYRQAALDRGWEEDTSLDIHGNGSWGNPIDTRNARYDVLTNSANIEEYLYGREYAVDRSPEEMYFNLYVEDEGDYWTIYFIFAYDM